MDVSLRERGVFAFGPFRLDPTRRTLRRDGHEVTLTARLFDTLLYLVQNPDRLVTRDELQGAVWGGRVVEDGNLQKAISALRKALQVVEGSETFIVTVPGRGFRFAAPVSFEAEPIADQQQGSFDVADEVARAAPARRTRWVRGMTAVVGGLAALAIVGGAVWHFADRTAAFSPPAHSVAVMAFSNLSGDPGQEYFSDGLSEELIDSLGHINALRVAARTSSFFFKGKSVTVGDIARQLNVGAVLEGSVRREGTHLRITAQLVDAATGYEFWSNHYDGDVGDTIKLQEQIARAAAASLQVTLLDAEEPMLDLGSTSNPKALDAYFRGLDFAGKNPNGADERALAAFNEAIALDHDFANARVQRALVLKDMVEFGSGTDPTGAGHMLDDALAETGKAVSIAPRLGWPYAARGVILVDQFVFSDAASAFEQARSAAPNDAFVEMEYGLFLIEMGHIAPGIEAATRAVIFDPVNANVYLDLAEAYYLSRQYDEASEALRHAQQFGDYVAARGMGLTGFVAIMEGDTAGAVRDCAGARDVLQVECLAVAYHKIGKVADGAALLAKLQQIAGDRGAFNYAEIYAQWGQPDDALHWLQTAYRLHDVGLTLLKVDPFLDPIRAAPEFKDIERRMNFPR